MDEFHNFFFEKISEFMELLQKFDPPGNFKVFLILKKIPMILV